MARVAALALLLGAAAAGAGAAAAAGLPRFDAHIHYSEDAWGTFPPEEVIAILERAGVTRALVSSTPDEGTLRLHALAPARVVPFLRPYRSRADMGSWHSDPEVLAWAEARLAASDDYAGIGEFHLWSKGADGPTLRRLAEIARERDLVFHAHTDAAGVQRLVSLYPEVRVLWAHAGLTTSVAEIAAVLERHPRVWIEISLRDDVAPHGALDAGWRDLFLAHPQRFLLGTDTWTPSRWLALVAEARADRAWLAQLPADVAAAIAHRNGERLFGAR